MTTARFRGVPLRMQQDGWRLDTPERTDPGHRERRKRDLFKAGLLGALIACGDVLVWNVVPALSLAVFILLAIWAGLAVAWPRLSARARVGIGCGAVMVVVPLVEQVQPLSILIAVAGLAAIGAALAGLGRADLLRGALRFWWVGPAHSVAIGAAAAGRLSRLKAGAFDARALVMGWAVPLGATVVFALLLIGANPVLDSALVQLSDWHPPAPNLWRLWVWLMLGLVIWPLLTARAMRDRMRARRPVRATVQRPGVVNAASVARSLVAFNALFAVQTVMDILFLYGTAGLPEGISPAAYAHRGAYPLLVTALLAGLFAVLARPHLAGRPALRWLMLVWLAQTLALVAASVWRLDIYVDAYGLTRLRLAAFVWMGLVASGLGLVVWQVWRDRPAAWMMLRSGALGAVTLYICALVSFDAIIAEHNLTRPVPPHARTLCELGEAALPAMARHLDQSSASYCSAEFYGPPDLFHPVDWREWGFRNWRVRRSLAAMTPTATAP